MMNSVGLYFSVIVALAGLQLSAPPSAIAQSEREVRKTPKAPDGGFAQRQYLLRQLLAASHGGPLANELALSESQKDQLNKIRSEYSELSKSLMGELQKLLAVQSDDSLSSAEKQQAMREAMKARDEKFGKITELVLKKMEEALLPNQIKRLGQIATQRELMARTGGDEFSIIIELSHRLELSKREKDRLNTEIKQARKEYNNELEELRSRYRIRIADILPEQAEERLREIIGDFFYSK